MFTKFLEVLKELTAHQKFSNDWQKTREQTLASIAISTTVIYLEDQEVVAETTGIKMHT